MIYVRDDDVLVNSSAYTDKRKTPLERFKQIHRWICDTPKLLHVPTLVVEPLMSHPEAVEFICSETEAGRMKPQIHGYEHIDYDQLSSNQVTEHLIKCKNFFWDQFGLVPTKWYTPWGANSSRLQFVASQQGLELIDCSKINKPGDILNTAYAGNDIEKFMDEKEIFIHWWERGMRLKRIVEILRHGSVESAKAANKEWF